MSAPAAAADAGEGAADATARAVGAPSSAAVASCAQSACSGSGSDAEVGVGVAVREPAASAFDGAAASNGVARVKGGASPRRTSASHPAESEPACRLCADEEPTSAAVGEAPHERVSADASVGSVASTTSSASPRARGGARPRRSAVRGRAPRRRWRGCVRSCSSRPSRSAPVRTGAPPAHGGGADGGGAPWRRRDGRRGERCRRGVEGARGVRRREGWRGRSDEQQGCAAAVAALANG